MQGLDLNISDQSVRKLKEQFERLIKELETKGKIDLKPNTAQIKDDLKQITGSIDEVLKHYEKLGKVSPPKRFYDENGNLKKFTIELERTEGIIERISHKASAFKDIGGGKLEPVSFKVDNITENDNRIKLAEKLAKQEVKAEEDIQKAIAQTIKLREEERTKLEELQAKAINKAMDEKYNDDLKLAELMAKGRENATLNPSQNSFVDPQAKYINKMLDDQYAKKLKLEESDRKQAENYEQWWTKALSTKEIKEREIAKKELDDNDKLTKQEELKLKLLNMQWERKVKNLRDNNVVSDDIINKLETSVSSKVSTGAIGQQELKNQYADILKLESDIIEKKRQEQKITSEIFNEGLREQDRISKLGEVKGVFDPSLLNKSTSEIKNFISGMYDSNVEVTKVQKSMDGLGTTATVKFKAVNGQIKEEKIVLDQATNSMYKQSEALKNVDEHSMGLGKHLQGALSSIASFAGISALFFGSIQKIKESIETVNEVNKSSSNIQMIAGMSRQEVQGLTKDLSLLADKLGDTTTNMLSGTEEFLRAGFKDVDLEKLVSTNTILSKISAQTQEETSQQIIAIKNAYEFSADEMQRVADKLTEVDSNSATSTKELSTAIQHTAESARLAGTDFDNLVSYIATVSETSRRSASSIGESLNLGLYDGNIISKPL